MKRPGKRAAAAALCMLLTVLAGVPGALAVSYWGSRGEEVRSIQQKLLQWGYFSGRVDGVFGQETYDAVVRFQKKNGLKADGVAGSDTLAAMGIGSGKKAVAVSASTGSSYAQNVELLARLIHGEARGEPYVGMVAVGAVVLNRVKSSRWPLGSAPSYGGRQI